MFDVVQMLAGVNEIAALHCGSASTYGLLELMQIVGWHGSDAPPENALILP